MTALPRPWRLLLPMLLLLVAASAAPADPDIRALGVAARDYRQLAIDLTGRTGTRERRQLHARALAVQATVVAHTANLRRRLAALQARLADPARPDAARRRRLEAAAVPLMRATADGDRLAGDTAALIAEAAKSRGDLLVDRLGQQTVSPLSPAFWDMLAAGAAHDRRRLGLLAAVENDVVGQSRWELWPFALGLLAAVLVLLPVRRLLRRLGREVVTRHAPTSRLRKSGRAAWIAVAGTVLPLLAATVATGGARAAGLLAPAWEPLADGLLRAAGVAGLICGLGKGLLMRGSPDWRLLPIATPTAQALRPWVWGAAALVFCTVMLDALRRAAGLSAGAGQAADAVITLAHLAFVVALLVRVGQLRVAAIASGDAVDDGAGETGTALTALVAWTAAFAAAAALLAGYDALALLLARLLLWLPVVVATFGLALVVADDLLTGLLSHRSAFGRSLHRAFGVRDSLIDQAGVALSALVRIGLLLLGGAVAAGPFGSNVGSLLDQVGRVAQGVTVGQVTISPGAVLRALLVLAAGLFAVRLVQRWLARRYLPVTDLDAGARNSIELVVRYTGLIVAALWALASLGLGLERIALLVSALSVGIGFGLQAITQNFVSGLILLAERPVKIGDLVRLNDQEGDVLRISVRATEIRLADRSTLIVPNSELITKAVRNLTLADPLGRVQLQFSVQLGADVAQVRTLVLGIFQAAPAVLDAPAPSVFIDSIADGRVNFNSFAYVASPRDAYPTRSALLFRLLDELPRAGIDLGTAPQQMQWLGPTPMPPAA